ncbi:putative methyltransferase-like protein C27D7.08c [Daldinia childiae]|uniref:putative methyltransferase-like protein C27D7.08c n=1 Tax=Daldinia childiae TaxID=326645 RepID=UPI0014469E3A|nr:putative methyltransferase-like protein C27D7.08c [Daldinia childiae]KAF3066454.1 putative methyltransferase-like protein C27D7.08c [Daldinia childiae]
MDTSGQDNGPKRGTKRKLTNKDGLELGKGFNNSSTILDQETSSSPATECSVTNNDRSSGPVLLRELRGDYYYKTLYTEELNFRLLGQHDPEFEAVLERGSHLDFNNPKSVMQLTKTLLKRDFGLTVDLPTDRLCPPVPNRHNYILWLKDLLDSSSIPYLDSNEPTRRVTGLDIGTGASLIYPLLGCVQRPSWTFIATDVNTKSLSYARKNVQLNNLQSRIRVVGRTITDCLIPLDELGLETINFTMVNPPFYTSEAELTDLAKQKSRPPNTACTGAPVEMVCTGGEIGFIQRMIDESLVLRERVQWYTCMLGKQSSLEVLVGILKEYGVTNYAITAFVQGNKTRRWAIGWSFGNRRPNLSASRGCEPSAGKKILPEPTEVIVVMRSSSQVELGQLERAVSDTMEGIDLDSWSWSKQLSKGVGFSNGNVWSRAYRRKKVRERGNTIEDESSSFRQKKPKQMAEQDTTHSTFGFLLTIQTSGDKDDKDQVAIVARWLQGNDHTIFESFTGFLRKAILASTQE